MPCYDPRPDTAEQTEVWEMLWSVGIPARKEDNLTKMLCDYCQSISAEELPSNISQWFQKHKEKDRERILEELSLRYLKEDPIIPVEFLLAKYGQDLSDYEKSLVTNKINK